LYRPNFVSRLADPGSSSVCHRKSPSWKKVAAEYPSREFPTDCLWTSLRGERVSLQCCLTDQLYKKESKFITLPSSSFHLNTVMLCLTLPSYSDISVMLCSNHTFEPKLTCITTNLYNVTESQKVLNKLLYVHNY
jgi:hypothetical protein